MNLRSVSEAAAELGISPQRIRALAQSGQIQADRVGGHWVIRDDSLSSPRDRAPGRPLSAANAWALLALLEGESPGWVHPSVRSRLRKRLKDSDWLARALVRSEPRANVNRWRLLPSDFSKIRASFPIVRSGLSAAGAALDLFSDEGPLDAYVSQRALAEIANQFKPLESSNEPNAFLRVPSHSWPLEHEGQVPIAVAAADLLSDEDPRVSRAARNVLVHLAE